ncbi:MAG: hypothetical protein IPM37_09585 [Hahellaceae bacterium]|nr:hypothetical protein [Hahellaceae bacterium]
MDRPATTINLRRPLDPAEHYFWLLDQAACMNFVVFAEIERVFSPEALNASLHHLVSEHALLRLALVPDEVHRLHFEICNDSLHCEVHTAAPTSDLNGMEAELNRTFPCHTWLWRAHAFPFSDGPGMRLALTFQHSLADGRTGINLLSEWLNRLLNSPSGNHLTNPATTRPGTLINPGLHDLFPSRFQWESQPEAATQLARQRRDEFKAHAPPAFPAYFQRGECPRQPAIRPLVLSAEQSQTLLNRCRHAGCTLHGLIAAVQLLALHQVADSDPSLNLKLTHSLTTPADLRPSLAHEGGTGQTLNGLYISMLSLNVPVDPGTDPFELARYITQTTRQQLERGDGHLLYHLYQPLSFTADETSVAQFCQQVEKAHPNSLISNLGRLDTLPGDTAFAVNRMAFALCPMPSQLLFNAVTTYQGQLIMNLNFDLGRTPEATAQAIHHHMQTLFQELCDRPAESELSQ